MSTPFLLVAASVLRDNPLANSWLLVVSAQIRMGYMRRAVTLEGELIGAHVGGPPHPPRPPGVGGSDCAPDTCLPAAQANLDLHDIGLRPRELLEQGRPLQRCSPVGRPPVGCPAPSPSDAALMHAAGMFPCHAARCNLLSRYAAPEAPDGSAAERTRPYLLRRTQGAPMETDCPPAMAPCFNISHVIDEHSPLYGKSLQDMQARARAGPCRLLRSLPLS